MVDFKTAVSEYFSNYCNFSGRASRSQYWWPVLFNFIVAIVLSIIGTLIGGKDVINILTGLYSLAVLLPSLGISVRRLHDIGKGGGWIFISLVPIIGSIWFLVLMLTASEPNDNRFGFATTY